MPAIITQNMDICWMKYHTKHFITYKILKLVSLKFMSLVYIAEYVKRKYCPREEGMFNINTAFLF